MTTQLTAWQYWLTARFRRLLETQSIFISLLCALAALLAGAVFFLLGSESGELALSRLLELSLLLCFGWGYWVGTNLSAEISQLPIASYQQLWQRIVSSLKVPVILGIIMTVGSYLGTTSTTSSGLVTLTIIALLSFQVAFSLIGLSLSLFVQKELPGLVSQTLANLVVLIGSFKLITSGEVSQSIVESLALTSASVILPTLVGAVSLVVASVLILEYQLPKVSVRPLSSNYYWHWLANFSGLKTSRRPAETWFAVELLRLVRSKASWKLVALSIIIISLSALILTADSKLFFFFLGLTLILQASAFGWESAVRLNNRPTHLSSLPGRTNSRYWPTFWAAGAFSLVSGLAIILFGLELGQGNRFYHLISASLLLVIAQIGFFYLGYRTERPERTQLIVFGLSLIALTLVSTIW